MDSLLIFFFSPHSLGKLSQVALCTLQPRRTCRQDSWCGESQWDSALQPGARAQYDFTLPNRSVPPARCLSPTFIAISCVRFALKKRKKKKSICHFPPPPLQPIIRWHLFLLSSMGRIVWASCAHTQSTPCNDYFSCLTQIAYRVPPVRGYGQHLCL